MGDSTNKTLMQLFCMVLNVIRKGRYSSVAQIFALMDNDMDKLISMSKIIGGDSFVKIPTLEEIEDMFKLTLCYYYRFILGITDWKEIERLVGFNILSDKKDMPQRVKNLNQALKNSVRDMILKGNEGNNGQR